MAPMLTNALSFLSFCALSRTAFGKDADDCHPVDPCESKFLAKGICIDGGKVLNINATWVSDFRIPGVKKQKFDYCNVIVTSTHDGWNDTVNNQVILPAADHWNGRFQGVGGGGWAANAGEPSLYYALAQGYSAGNTDSGHDPLLPDSETWWQDENGEPNMELLKNFATRSLKDLADMGKQLSRQYYGRDPKYSYWNGCSTGGRQGWQMAQKHPTAYDGIYAASPAAQWDRFQVAQYWGQFVMNRLDHYPNQCVFEAFNEAVVSKCDELDGVKDGVIANFEDCKFDPETMVGKKVHCDGDSIEINGKDAEIVSKVWEGPRSRDGSFVWWGTEPGAPFDGLTNTTCQGSSTNCTGVPAAITTDWISRWCLGDEKADLTELKLDEFIDIFDTCKQKYEKTIGTNDADLKAFARAGGKMITWHGQADQAIYPAATADYYKRVLENDPEARDYFRFFYAPGVQHCGGGMGEEPTDPFQAVVDWVEKGKVPETLPASRGKKTKNLCPWPLHSVYKGKGDVRKASSFECKRHF